MQTKINEVDLRNMRKQNRRIANRIIAQLDCLNLNTRFNKLNKYGRANAKKAIQKRWEMLKFLEQTKETFTPKQIAKQFKVNSNYTPLRRID